MNAVYKLLQSLPTNGYTTAIGAIGLIMFGIGGLITGKVPPEEATGYVLAGVTALGLGNKFEKMMGSYQEPPSAS